MKQPDIMKSVAKAIGAARCKPHACPWWEDEHTTNPAHISDRLFDREMANAAVVDYIKCTAASKHKDVNTYKQRIEILESDIEDLEEEQVKLCAEVGVLAGLVYKLYEGKDISKLDENVASVVKMARKIMD